MSIVRARGREPLPQAPPEYDKGDQERTRTAIGRALDDLARPASSSRYEIPSALTPDRDADTMSTLTETQNVLRTLILDLRSKGFIS